MLVKNLNTEESKNKRWAAMDAQMRSVVNSTQHSEASKLRAERMKSLLEFIFDGKIYIAYGKRGVSIKVDKGQTKSNYAKGLLEKIERQWDSEGVMKKISPQGVIYTFN